jgi:hypothetical protein
LPFLVLLVVYLVRCDKKENAALSWRSVLNYFIPFARSVRSMPVCDSLFLGNECVKGLVNRLGRKHILRDVDALNAMVTMKKIRKN